ncbi:MAG TPA: LURP-one-related family protein [Thermoanaerobaculia bacterium]|nr:LURP-one-related family protein [Thermoanaerobaculia bacterium]
MRYVMQEKLVSFGDDYVIRDESGREAFRVDGKVLTVRDALVLEDAAGNRLANIHKKLLSIGKTYEIEREGQPDVSIHKSLFSPLHCKFRVDAGGDELEARGDLLDHEYTFTRNSREVASVSKKWFSIRDTYGVEVAEGEDHALILACAVAIDRMCHEEDE